MNRKLFVYLILVLSLLLGSFTGCSGTGKKGNETDSAETGEKPVVLPKLTEITVDRGYGIDFSADVNEYTVSIPAGRPAVPKVSAKAESNTEVKIIQATISDGETSGPAKIIVTANGKSNVYTVNFVKDSGKGFQLQYADVYAYTPDYTLKDGEKITYSSSDENVLTVDKTGKVKAIALSDTAVAITASVGTTEVGKLVVDKVVKAPINIFLIIGQSNAFGWHDIPSDSTMGKYFKKQREMFDKPIAGTVWADDITTSYDDYQFSEMYDLCRNKGTSGFYPALGKEWYALTGEKSLMLKTAVGSTPIEAWTADPLLKFYGIDLYAMTVERFNYYKEMFEAEDSAFTLNRVYAYWLQGETCQEYVYDPSEHTWENKNGQKNYKYMGDWKAPSSSDDLMTAEEYYTYFMSMYNSLVKDIGLEFIGIIPVRAMESVSSAENRKEQQLIDIVAPRAAQFALNYRENGHIAIVTLQTEIGRTESYTDKNAEGWGYMGCYNIHYNQIGYNAIGKDAALNTYNIMSATTDKTAEDIKVLDSNGRTVISDRDTIKIDSGSTRQITAIVLPLYSDASTLSFEISDTSLCSIDSYGMLTVPYKADSVGKSVTLTISNGTISKTVTIEIT